MPALPDAQAIMASRPTVSGRIRALAAAGYTRSQIKDLVDRSYQQVRQVLVDEEKRQARRSSAFAMEGPGVQEDPVVFSRPTQTRTPIIERLELNDLAQVALSPALLDVLGARIGDPIMAVCEGEGLVVLMSARTAMRQAHAIVRSFVPAGVSLVDELLADRRAEAARENGDG